VRACASCLRRSWLISVLSDHLQDQYLLYSKRDYVRLVNLFTLSDHQLIAWVGAANHTQLRERYEQFDPEWVTVSKDAIAICLHDPCYPKGLADVDGAPAVLYLSGALEHADTLLASPKIAIVGTLHPTAYGVGIARRFACELAGAGVTVLSGRDRGICTAAHTGILDMGSATLVVSPGGVDIPLGSQHLLYERQKATGLILSELPCGFRSRHWCFAARNRIIAALAGVTLVVESEVSSGGAMMIANLAAAAGNDVAAVPGSVMSGGSEGPHALIKLGAELVRNTEDLLDLLYGAGQRPPEGAPTLP
jgi:DNA processing protein